MDLAGWRVAKCPPCEIVSKGVLVKHGRLIASCGSPGNKGSYGVTAVTELIAMGKCNTVCIELSTAASVARGAIYW